MEERVEIPETKQIEQGRVVSEIRATPTILEKAREYVMSSVNFFEGQRGQWRERNRQKDRAYRAILEPPRQEISNQRSTTSGRAYVGFDDKAAPIIHDNCEAIKARIVESVLPINQNIVDIESDEMNSQLKEIRTKQLNLQLEKNNIESKIHTVVHNAVVYGTFFLSVPFINEEKTVLTRQLVQKQVPLLDKDGEPVLDSNGQPIFDVVQDIDTVAEIDKKYFGPGYEPIKDIEDVYLDMFIENIQDQPIVIRKFVVQWDHLMQGVEAGIYFEDKVKNIKGENVKTGFGEDALSRSEEVLSTTNNFEFNDGKRSDSKPNEYEMYQAYCDFQVEEFSESGEKIIKTQKMVISVVGNEVIQFMPNPYFHQMIPIIKGTYRGLPGEAYGLSAVDPVLDMYREYNDTMNQVNDAKILGLNPIKIVANKSVADKQDLDISPGVVWYEKQPGDIRFASFDFTPVSNGVAYLDLLELKINRGMGVQRLMQGMGDSSDLDKTARGVTKVIEQADKKFRSIAKNIEYFAIKEWAEMAYKVNLQFTPLPSGNDTFSQINSEVGFVVSGVDNFFDNLEEVEKLTAFTQQASALPGINTVGLVLTIADKLGIKIDEQKYGPLFMPPQPEGPEEKPMNVSTNISIDPSKGTYMAMLAAQILAQKGIQPDLDAIGEASSLITNDAQEEVKQESGILPQERKASVHTIRTKDNTEVEKTITNE